MLNLTFSEFNKFIENDDITSYEQKLILYTFQQLYPEQYFQMIYNSSLNNKENIFQERNFLNRNLKHYYIQLITSKTYMQN